MDDKGTVSNTELAEYLKKITSTVENFISDLQGYEKELQKYSPKDERYWKISNCIIFLNGAISSAQTLVKWLQPKDHNNE